MQSRPGLIITVVIGAVLGIAVGAVVFATVCEWYRADIARVILFLAPGAIVAALVSPTNSSVGLVVFAVAQALYYAAIAVVIRATILHRRARMLANKSLERTVENGGRTVRAFAVGASAGAEVNSWPAVQHNR